MSVPVNKRHSAARKQFQEIAKAGNKDEIRGAAQIIGVYAGNPDFGKEYYEGKPGGFMSKPKKTKPVKEETDNVSNPE